MHSIERVKQNIRFFLATPKSRLYFIFLFSLALLGIIIVFFLPFFFLFISLIILIFLGTGIFVVMYQSARLEFGSSVSSINRDQLGETLLELEDAVVMYDAEFQLLAMNRAAEQLFHLKAPEVIGRKIEPRDAEDPRMRLFAQVMFPSLAPTFIPRGESGSYPSIADLAFDAPELHLRVTTIAIVPLPREEASGAFLKVIRDRTEEVALVRSKNEFVAITSHQLRTPINEAKWGLEAFLGEERLGEQGKSLLLNTIASLERLLALVESLLKISQISQGKVGYRFTPTNIVAFFEEVLARVFPQAQHLGIKLLLERPEQALPELLIDPEKFSLALTNILDNAIRYNVEHGEVVISIKKQENAPFVEVSVKDTGIGVPLEEIKNLFGKFFRARNAVKFQTEGTGLGLYIAKSVIEAHGGKMWAVSEVNRGSTFFFTLPTDPSLVPQREVAREEE